MMVIFLIDYLGRFICVCAENGVVSVWELIKEMKENIISILLEMQKNTKFWESFRINYENTKKYNYKEILNTKSFDRIETTNFNFPTNNINSHTNNINSPTNTRNQIKGDNESAKFSPEEANYKNDSKFYRNSNENKENNNKIKENRFVEREIQTNQMSFNREKEKNINNNNTNNVQFEHYNKKKFKEEQNFENTAK